MNKITDEKIIDWATIMDVCGYEDMVEEVIKSSMEEAGQTVGLLAKAIKTDNSADVALYAHRLKGVAMTMGATVLSKKAYRVECAGDEKDIKTAALLFNDLKDEIDKVIAFLSRADWIETAKQGNGNKE